MDPSAGSEAVPRCPACGRPAASIRIARCLFCNTSFGPELSNQLERLREQTPEDGSPQLRRALLLGFGTDRAAARPERRRRSAVVLVTAVLLLGLIGFGAGALYLLISGGGIEAGRLAGSVRSLATLAGGLALIAVVIALAFVFGRRWDR